MAIQEGQSARLDSLEILKEPTIMHRAQALTWGENVNTLRTIHRKNGCLSEFSNVGDEQGRSAEGCLTFECPGLQCEVCFQLAISL